MRARAFRRGVGLLALLVVLSGCSSATKRNYLRQLSLTIAPLERGAETVATSNGPVVAAANRAEP